MSRSRYPAGGHGPVCATSLSPYESLLTALDNRYTTLPRNELASCTGLFPLQASVTSTRRGEPPPRTSRGTSPAPLPALWLRFLLRPHVLRLECRLPL
ncbi:hypothetical protein VTO73DRAFT_11607 [Trametes versicolor]